MKWVFAATLIISGLSVFTACSSSDDDGEKKIGNLTPEMLAGLWVTDNTVNGQDGDYSWTREVEDYQFNADGTGYYERYLLDGELLVAVKSIRDADTFHYTIDGYTITITGDENNMKQTLTYADGRLTAQGKTLQKTTTELQTLVNQLYAEWQGGNSGTWANITYIERSWDGNKVVEKEVTEWGCSWLNEVASIDKSSLRNFWYVTGNCEIKKTIRASDDLNIILCDDAVLKVKGIIVEGDNTLRIFGQKRGTGQLIIEDTPSCPGIGPDNSNGGHIEIHGGQITAEGSNGCAGIGGGYKTKTGFLYWENNAVEFYSIKIFDGVIHATGGGGAAGIGAGVKSYGKGNIFIYGGYIYAQGGGYAAGFDCYGGAGIGGGSYAPIATVNIYGGNINAKGGSEAAGIGCGEDAEGKGYNGTGAINISGGNVEAWGGDHGAGIGGGDGVYLGEIHISGGEVKAHGGVNAAGIGGGEGAEGGDWIDINGGTVYAYAGADGAGIGGGEGGDGGYITIRDGKVYAYGNAYSNGFGAGIGGGQDGNSGKILIVGGEVHAYGGDDAAGIGTGEETTSGPNIKADNITISGGTVEAVGGGYGAGIGAGQDAEVGTITITTEDGDVYVSGRSGNDCGLWAGSIGAYKVDARGTLNIGKGVKVIGITDFNNGITWTDIPVELNPVAWIYERCHVQLKTCDHPGYTAQTCVFCKH